MKNTIRIVIAAVAVGLGTGAAQAGRYTSSLSRDAHRIVDYANDLSREVGRHFRHTAEYRHLLIDAASIRREALHIDSLSHHVHGLDDVGHLREDLAELDELVHHVAELIEEIAHGHGHGGHVHGDTHHVSELIAWMNRTIHSMERKVDEIERSFRHRDHDHRIYDDRRSVGERIAGGVLRQALRRR